jgi:hypothetical protein
VCAHMFREYVRIYRHDECGYICAYTLLLYYEVAMRPKGVHMHASIQKCSMRVLSISTCMVTL